MKHHNEQAMLMYFLGRIDFDRDWVEVNHDMGYDFGDFAFTKLTPAEIVSIAKMMWVSLNGKGLHKPA